jgi:hypothetical protein
MTLGATAVVMRRQAASRLVVFAGGRRSPAASVGVPMNWLVGPRLVKLAGARSWPEEVPTAQSGGRGAEQDCLGREAG